MYALSIVIHVFLRVYKEVRRAVEKVTVISYIDGTQGKIIFFNRGHKY